MGDWKISNVDRSGVLSQEIVSNAKHCIFIGEEETLPVYSTMVAIPEGMDVEMSADYANTDKIGSVSFSFRNKIISERGEDDLYPTNKIVVSEPGQFRDFRIVNINVYPFQYNAKSSELDVVKTTNITLRFVPSRNSYVNPAKGFYSSSFDNLYRSLILNYESTRDDMEQIKQPVLLIIYPENADETFNSKRNEFIRWKRQKGYIVNTVTTSVTGTVNTSIKAYIQSQYDSIETRPDIVLFIGDTTGSYAIPTFTESSFSTSNGDYTYSLLAGNDQYGEVQIGRISISTTEEFAAYVNKTIYYESKINVANATWLNKMLLVGHTGVTNDSNASGISTVFTNKYIKEISQVVNPAYTYLEHYGNLPTYSTQINSAISSGVGIFNYRGWLGMSGWSSQINSTATDNPLKYNHGIFITCGTGSFAGSTSPTEQYIRIGTSSVPKGGITAIGMDTSSTHTGMNNGLDGALFDGIYNHGMRSMGEALLFSKCYMHSVFANSNVSLVTFFVRICNLMGDPTAEIYTSIPKTFNANIPSSLLIGSNILEVKVQDSDMNDLSNSTVHVFHEVSGYRRTAYTDLYGKVFIDLSINLSDSILVTISKHDYKPYTKYVKLLGTGLIYQSSVIDDDSIGQSIGNGNGVINAGETIEYQINVTNTTDSNIRSVSAMITTQDPYVTMLSNTMSVSSINSNTTALLSTIRFSVSANCPNNHQLIFNISGSSSAGNWNGTIKHIVYSPDLDFISYQILGINSFIGINETASLQIEIKNNGSESVSNVLGILRVNSQYVQVIDSLKSFGSLLSGNSVSNTLNPFLITSSFSAVEGMVIPMALHLYNNNGYNDIEYFSLTIGNTSVTSPLGQDDYGYFIYDIGDTSYPDCPTYDWIGIAPAEGGAGVSLAIIDPYVSNDEGDQIGSDPLEVVSLPFSFKYYGINYTQITIASNGFIAFGVTENHDFRNWRLPGAVGPNAMVAAFWDDLATHSGSGIYAYNDDVNHRYIVEWYNMINGYNGTSTETFQIILYDPVFYQTQTGDGQIKIQYKVFNNIASTTGTGQHGCYSTIGIKDHTGLRGLEYSFNNQYPKAARPLSNDSALLITTFRVPSPSPLLTVSNINYIDSNGNGIAEPNESLDTRLTIANHGTGIATNVQITISENDPWINVSSSSVFIGNINGLSTAENANGLNINILEGCPTNHTASVNVLLTCDNYTFNTSFEIVVKIPIFLFSEVSLSDFLGNNNGHLDPGETALISVQISNIGGVSSQAGTVSLSCSAPGITVNIPTSISISSIASNDSLEVQFNITASTELNIGFMIELSFLVHTSNYSTSYTSLLEISPPIEILVGSGSSIQSYPLDRYYNYSVHESIYLASEIGSAGFIKSLGYFKASGTDTNPIESVLIYLKNASAATLESGTYSTTGYTQVYSGTFPNNATSGWMEITFDSLFEYNGIGNLSVLVIKNYQSYISNHPMWSYTTTTSNRARQNRSDSSMPTSLTASNYLPNIKFKIYPNNDTHYPPHSLKIYALNQKVSLSWSAPLSGTPSSYSIYRNSSLLTTTNNLTYNDYTVTNGIEYSYYITAYYTTIPIGESEPSNTVNAIPTTTPLVTIGESTTSQRQPFGMFYGYERDASLYLSNEVGIFGEITNIQWYVSTSQTTTAPLVIRLLSTSQTSLSAVSWSSILTNSTIVYTSSNESFSDVGWKTIALTNPYSYLSGNLLVLIETNYGGSGSNSYPTFRYSSSSSDCHQQWATDTNPPSVNGALNTNRPNIRIQFDYPAPVPSIAISHYSIDFGNVFVGTSLIRQFSISNNGEGILDGQITTPADYSLTSDRVLDVNGSVRSISRNTISYSIVSGQSKYFTLVFTPTQSQTYNGILSIISDAPSSSLLELPVNGVGIIPTFNPPTQLQHSSSMGSVTLTWTTPVVNSGELVGYRVYRNGLLITQSAINQTTYQDVGLVNETTYEYYVKAIYSNPTGESDASNLVNATPTAYIPVTGVIGTGTNYTSNNFISPINLSYRSVHGQSVYTATELNSIGIYGPVFITQLGFNIATSPALALPSFIIRMKHTSSIDAQNWHNSEELFTVYQNSSYMPTSGGYDMLSLSTPFLWNGIDNIVVDTAFSLADNFSNSGTLQYTSMTNGFRAARLDTEDQTNIFTGGQVYSRRANIKVKAQNFLTDPLVMIESLDNMIKLSWEPIIGSVRYKIYSSTESDRDFTLYDATNSNEYIINNVENKKFFRVTASND